MKAVGIIPARYASSRFPGKALAMLGDRTLIQHVYDRASEAETLSLVVVATDDNRIASAVRDFGGKVVMIGNMVATQFGKSFNWPLGAAMAVSILVCAFVIVVVMNWAMSHWRPR